MSKVLKGYLLFSFAGLCAAYVLATEYLSWAFGWAVGYTFLLRNAIDVFSVSTLHHQVALIILGFGTLGGAAFAQRFVTPELTTYGESDWQSKREMAKNGYFQKPGLGFIVAKTTGPESPKGKLLSSTKHHHCLVIAPTGSGKGRGFVIPNLLAFAGSTVTLDVKGANYDATARYRSNMGDDVYLFAPLNSKVKSHSFNPLERIAGLKDTGDQMLELESVSFSFLETSNDKNQSLLEGGREAFVAAGMMAIELGDPTIAKIYDLINTGQEGNRDLFISYANQTTNPETRKLWESVAKNDPESLANMISILNTAGLGLWKHRRVREATTRSDFSFDTLRTKPASIYFALTSKQIDQAAALVRLFFTELVATLESRIPNPKTEPFSVMMILDEFHKLGRMTQLTNAITTLREYNGKIAIVTQTIPELIDIYGENKYRSIEGGCGIKFYMTPSERETAEELSISLGMTTKPTLRRNHGYAIGVDTTLSEATEEASLMPVDDVLRMDPEAVVLVLKGEKPIKARNILWYRDPYFRNLEARQHDVKWEGLISGGPIAGNPIDIQDDKGGENNEASEVAASPAEPKIEEPTASLVATAPLPESVQMVKALTNTVNEINENVLALVKQKASKHGQTDQEVRVANAATAVEAKQSFVESSPSDEAAVRRLRVGKRKRSRSKPNVPIYDSDVALSLSKR